MRIARHRAWLAPLLAPLALAPLVAGAQAPPTTGTASPTAGEATAPAVVYGFELEAEAGRDRILVFADRPVVPEVEERDAGTVVVRIPHAVLDPTAPERLEPRIAGGLIDLRASERRRADGPSVELVIERTPGGEVNVERRGATFALDLPRPVEPPDVGISLRFDQGELKDIVDAVAEASGEIFLYDDSLRGNVTISIARRVSPAEALELLHSVLLLVGYAAVPTPGGAWRILTVPQTATGAPWKLGDPEESSEAPVATLVDLHSAMADDVVRALSPWVGKTSFAMAHAPTNSILLAGSERRLARLLEMVRVLDAGAEVELVVRRLRHRDADSVADFVRSAFGDDRLPGEEVEVWPHASSNSLVLRAAPHVLDEVRAFLFRLDRPPEGGGAIQIIRPRVADPDALAAILAELSAGGGSEQVPSRAGRVLQGRSFNVAVDQPTGSILVRGDPETLELVRSVIAELDRSPRIVEVEVIVMEIDLQESLELGIDAFIPFSSPSDPGDVIGGFLLNPSGGGLLNPGLEQAPAFAARYTRAPLVIPIVDEAGLPVNLIVPRASGVVTADERQVKGHVVMRPHLRVVSGQEHEIFAGDNIPIPVASQTALALSTSQNIERRDVGVRLRVRPVLGEEGGVRLDLDVETSRVGPPIAGDPEVVGSTIRQRRLETTAILRDDEIAVVGMVVQPNWAERRVGTPWLMDTPGVGPFFRKTREASTKTRLVITAQARILETPEEATAESIRRRIGFERRMAREDLLGPDEKAPWAVLVTSREVASDARAIAQSLADSGEDVVVVPWEWGERTRWDVYLVGFETIVGAGAASERVQKLGYTPELAVRPPR